VAAVAILLLLAAAAAGAAARTKTFDELLLDKKRGLDLVVIVVVDQG
jgi:hypothetical protein